MEGNVYSNEKDNLGYASRGVEFVAEMFDDFCECFFFFRLAQFVMAILLQTSKNGKYKSGIKIKRYKCISTYLLVDMSK